MRLHTRMMFRRQSVLAVQRFFMEIFRLIELCRPVASLQLLHLRVMLEREAESAVMVHPFSSFVRFSFCQCSPVDCCLQPITDRTIAAAWHCSDNCI